MKVYRTVAEMQAARKDYTGDFGLVPTMGYLHEGHLSLVRSARSQNTVCAAWIFVNPTQFGPGEDFQRYPRDEAQDLELLEREGVDVLFAPSVDEIYPPGFDTFVKVGRVSERLEGTSRPGHFRGVATVVTKFFNIMQPTRAYFGQKDAQQVVVVKKLVRDLDLNIEIVACPTIREADGLAMSSRNAYLERSERKAATVLYRALRRAQEGWDAGERSGDALRRDMLTVLNTQPLARVDYVSVADTETLEELDVIRGPALASMAVYIGMTRLIDNVLLSSEPRPGS